MKRMFIVFMALISSSALAKSLLQAASFPNTFQDVSFTEKIEVLTAGYEPWQSEYDANGNCISGCAYQGIRLEDEQAAVARATAAARQQLIDSGVLSPAVPAASADSAVAPSSTAITGQGAVIDNGANVFGWTETTQPAPMPQNAAQPTPSSPSVSNIVNSLPAVGAGQCFPNQPKIAVGQIAPKGEPLINSPKISSPYDPNRVHPVYGTIRPHNAIDFAVPIGTSVFTTAEGTVKVAGFNGDGCGNRIIILHPNNFETVYCHLDKMLVRVGDSVHAGCLIAKSGNTGIGTGAHLHYGIKYQGTYINPTELVGR